MDIQTFGTRLSKIAPPHQAESSLIDGAASNALPIPAGAVTGKPKRVCGYG